MEGGDAQVTSQHPLFVGFTARCVAEEDQEEEEGDVQVTCQHLFVGFTQVCVVEEDPEEEEEGGDVNLTCQHLFVGFTHVSVVEEDQEEEEEAREEGDDVAGAEGQQRRQRSHRHGDLWRHLSQHVHLQYNN